jgi:shikimate kinase
MAIVDTIISALITGIGSGAGIAVGTYFAQKTILEKMQKFEEKIKKRKEQHIKALKKKRY